MPLISSQFMPPFLSWYLDIYYHYSELLFHVDCLSPLRLVVLIGINLGPSFATYFFVFSFFFFFFWALYACGFLSTNYKTVVPFSSGVVCSLVNEIGLEACAYCPHRRVDWYCGNSSLAWILSGASPLFCDCHCPVKGRDFSLVVGVDISRYFS